MGDKGRNRKGTIKQCATSLKNGSSVYHFLIQWEGAKGLEAIRVTDSTHAPLAVEGDQFELTEHWEQLELCPKNFAVSFNKRATKPE